MTRLFQVAELLFSLDLPDGHPVWEQLHNYDPFEKPLRPGSQPPETSGCAGPLPSDDGPLPLTMPRVAWFPEATAGDAVLFSLTLSEEAPEGERTPVYVPQTRRGEPVANLWRYGAQEWLAEFAASPAHPICGQLVFSNDFRQGRLHASGSVSDQAFAVSNALMLLFAFASAPFSALEMHASVVMHGGRGFMFLGRSGTGKSTHSRLWLQHIPQTELLNDDNPVLRIVDGCIRVFGTPWSGKTPCYKAQDVPVGAIVRLRQAPRNAITRLGAVQAYASLMASCSSFRPIRQIADTQHATLEAVVGSIPCYQLDCLPDEAAARLCQQTVDG